MTKKTSTPAPTRNDPAYVVWFSPAREGAPRTRLGVLWPRRRRDKGFFVSLEHVLPVKGNIIVLPYEPREAEEGEGA